MILLAFEMSSVRGEVALLRDESLLAVAHWDEQKNRSQHLFTVLPPLLEKADVAIEQVEVFAVGLGPGSYTGMRVALTAAQALALPRGKPVFNLSSGESIAAEVFAQDLAEKVAVVGDARRGRMWGALFTRGDGSIPVLQDAWRLLEAGAPPPWCEPGTIFASSQQASLREGHPGLNWWPYNLLPQAEWIGRLAFLKMRAGLPSLPPQPIYMHPPVFVPPTFPADQKGN